MSVRTLFTCAVVTAALAACGGGEPAPWTPYSKIIPPTPCTNEDYEVGLWSSSGPVTGAPREMEADVTGCAPLTLAGVPIDWTVTGGGSIAGQTTTRTWTDSNGKTRVTWTFAPGSHPQSIEAEYRGWELTRVRLYTDGSRRVLLRRKKTRHTDQPGP